MPLIILIAEVILVYQFILVYGFFNFLVFYFVSTALGVLIVRAVGSKSLKDFQTGMVSGNNRSMISRGLLFLSGLFLIVPSMTSKITGALLVIPPVRWLAAIAFSNFLVKRVFSANSFVHQFGNGGFRFYYQQTGNPFQNAQTDTRSEASDNVIDAQFRKVEDNKLLKEPDSDSDSKS